MLIHASNTATAAGAPGGAILATAGTDPGTVDPAALALVGALPVDQHPAAVYLAGLASGSRRTMRDALNTIARLLTGGRSDAPALQWGALRYQHTAAVRAALAERYTPATANKALAALRGVLKEAWRLGQLPGEEYRRAADLPAVRGETLPAGRALAVRELVALFGVCVQDTPAGAQDAALLAVLYGATAAPERSGGAGPGRL